MWGHGTEWDFLLRSYLCDRGTEWIPIVSTRRNDCFIPMDIAENVVKSVERKLFGSSGPGGMDSKALQGWLLKFGEDSKILCTSVDIFVDWISNQSPPPESYRSFVSDHLIVVNKRPFVIPVGVEETWQCLFTKCVLRVMRTEATNACQDD